MSELNGYLSRLYIDGVWCCGTGSRFDDVYGPATETVVGQVAHAGDADVDRAVDAARRAAAAWRATDVTRRSEILRLAGERLAVRSDAAAVALTIEQGKTLARSSSAPSRRSRGTWRTRARCAPPAPPTAGRRSLDQSR
jgi:acyl-CoA reductase-like NAD-dependent aldehyde dehydrogenase